MVTGRNSTIAGPGYWIEAVLAGLPDAVGMTLAGRDKLAVNLLPQL